MKKIVSLLIMLALSVCLLTACGEEPVNGLTPTIGENGNWWIGDTDTGVNASGIKGEKGDTGAQGEKGDTGAQGEKGDTGAQGEKGDTGAQGEKGDTGAQGEKGDTGAQGQKGDTGAQGEKGDPGKKGDRGEKGEPGKDGITPPTPLFKLDDQNRFVISYDGGTTWELVESYPGNAGGTVTPEPDLPTPCEHRDANDDGKCDKCSDDFTDGTDTPVACEHRDANDDDKCDKCAEDFSDGPETSEENPTLEFLRDNSLPIYNFPMEYVTPAHAIRTSDNKYVVAPGYAVAIIDITGTVFDNVTLGVNANHLEAGYAFLTDMPVIDQEVSYAGDYTKLVWFGDGVTEGVSVTVDIPEDANYLVVYYSDPGPDVYNPTFDADLWHPEYIIFENVDPA